MGKTIMFTDAQKELMRKAYESNNRTLQDLANEYGVSVPTISRTLKAMEVPVRARGRRPGAKLVKPQQPVEEKVATEPEVFETAEETPTFPEW